MFVFCIILESWLSGQFKKLMIYKHILQIMTEKWLWIWFLSVYFLQSDLHHKILCRQVIFDNLLHCNTILECWEHVDSYTFSEMLWTFVFDKEIEKNTCPKKVAIPCKCSMYYVVWHCDGQKCNTNQTKWCECGSGYWLGLGSLISFCYFSSNSAFGKEAC